MPDAFLWNLRQGDRAQTYVLHGLTVIAIARRPGGGRDIMVDLHEGATIARNHALQLTEHVEGQGLKLDQIYGCRGSEEMLHWMSRARAHYRDDEVLSLAHAVDMAIQYITLHGEVLHGA